jgi:hypothetical protein
MAFNATFLDVGLVKILNIFLQAFTPRSVPSVDDIEPLTYPTSQWMMKEVGELELVCTFAQSVLL